MSLLPLARHAPPAAARGLDHEPVARFEIGAVDRREVDPRAVGALDALRSREARFAGFNWPCRDERLNEHGFTGLSDARFAIECWRRDDDEQRPHSALGNRTPA